MKYERVDNGAVAVVAVIGEENILLIRNPGRVDWKWKLVAETNKPGESILNTLKSALEEEAGLSDVKTELGPDGKIARFADPRIKRIVQFGEPELIRGRYPHWRHFFGVMLSDREIQKLSGERHTIEEEDGEGGTEVEDIETMEFPLRMLDTITNLLRPHAELIRSIPNRVTIDIK